MSCPVTRPCVDLNKCDENSDQDRVAHSHLVIHPREGLASPLQCWPRGGTPQGPGLGAQ